MNFFEQQEQARYKTKKLIFLFSAAVFAIVIILTLLVMFVFGFLGHDKNFSLRSLVSRAGFEYEILPADIASLKLTTKEKLHLKLLKAKGKIMRYGRINQFNWPLFLAIGLITSFFLFLSTIYKKRQLSYGGGSIIQKLGGKLISRDTNDKNEKQLLNIVEEMAIASGVVVPPIYLMNETGINAFAAGFDINDAAIGITKGAVKILNRDELQGIIAHEFSHIFNGDMHLNLKLISILHGILVIGIIGNYIFRKTAYGRSSKGRVKVFIFGFSLMAVGYIGTFFGSLIKASISRQREYLADASAVQFTRNPHGISSALKKIGGYKSGSKIHNIKSLEVSHMFFAQGFNNFPAFLMATHPPLNARILTIDPNWDGEFIKNIDNSVYITRAEKQYLENKKRRITRDKKKVFTSSMAGMAVIQSIGNISQKSVSQASDLIHSIPEIIKNNIHNSFGARAVIYSLIIVKDSDFYQKQLQYIKDNIDPEVLKLTKDLHIKIGDMEKKFRLPLIDMSIPALKRLSVSQYHDFKINVKLLIKSNSKTSIFEWSLMRILSDSLDREFNKNYIDVKSNLNLQYIRKEVGLFLSLMSYTGQKDVNDAKKSFNQAAIEYNLVRFPFFKKDEIKNSILDKSIVKLKQLKPLEKQKLLRACVVCMSKNGVLFCELELLRAFCAILNCPMPLLSE